MPHSKTLTILKLTVLSSLTVVLFASCLKDAPDTIVLPLPDGKIPTSVIAADIQDSLRTNGFVINEGITPPNIEGIYMLSPVVLHYASDGYNNLFFDVVMHFNNQKQRGMLVYAERQRDSVEGASIAAQVIGHDSCFTMYCYQDVAEYSDYVTLWSCRIATVVSGVLTPTGIRDCQYSFIMLDKEGANDYYLNQLASTGTFRIYNDGDSIAQRMGVRI